MPRDLGDKSVMEVFDGILGARPHSPIVEEPKAEKAASRKMGFSVPEGRKPPLGGWSDIPIGPDPDDD